MTPFIIWALVLTAVATALVAIPLVRAKGGEPRAPWTALAAGAVITLGAAALYATLSNWSWRPSPPNTPQAMVAQLARRLERHPDDLNGWLMLGRSYTVLEQFPLAARAYQRADRIANGKSTEALIGLGEALALQNEEALNGRAGQFFERALALDPTSGKALFYGAAAALRRNDLPLARQRFASLLALDPPANIKPILESQIAAIDRKLTASPTPP